MDVSTRLSNGSVMTAMSPTQVIIDLDSDNESKTTADASVAQQRGVDGDTGLEESGDEVKEEASVDADDNDFDDMESTNSMDSLLEDAIVEIEDDKLCASGPDVCSLQEATYYRQLLRSDGPAEFCRKTIEEETITAKKLLTAFGIRPPEFLEGSPDEAYYSLLSLAISRELSKRLKLSQYNTIDDAVDLIKKSKNIIVVTGAGISTSLGIPDFRSKDGLYKKYRHLGLDDPQDIFSLSIFRENPEIFYEVCRKDILPYMTDKFTPTHAFIAMLQAKGKLLTNYSQNIDNIEASAGINSDKLIQCHGSFATASCIECQHKVPGEELFPDIRAGRIPKCPKCEAASKLRPVSMKRKRSYNSQDKKRTKQKWDLNGGDTDEEDDYDSPKSGVMKPDITFFGEALPDDFSNRLSNHDKDKVDLVIVIGTSLKVAPVSDIVPFLPAHVPQMYISKTPVGHVNFDVDMLGSCDVVVAELCKRAGWELNHEMIPKDQVIEVNLQHGYSNRHIFKSNYDKEDVVEQSKKGKKSPTC